MKNIDFYYRDGCRYSFDRDKENNLFYLFRSKEFKNGKTHKKVLAKSKDFDKIFELFRNY